ncbi:MAG: PAS domain S-box protein, partial [Helicobacteraceae bacterium]|nr:PAS domain S-box protein [Candidatus Sulfurimonas ponti]
MEENVTCQTLENNSENEVPITTQEYNNILNIQNTILEMIASHEKASDIFTRLCLMAEALLTNSVASIMLKDKVTGLISVLSAPSVPKEGRNALKDLKPIPRGGSCANAVFHNEAQYVADTFTDERWENLRQLAYDFNLCSCWSMPVRDKDKQAVGTFALSSFEHRSPAPFHKKLLEMSASIVSIVLRNQEDEQRIKLFSTSMQNATEGMMITDADNNIIEVNKAFEKIYGYQEKDLLGQNPRILTAGKSPKE